MHEGIKLALVGALCVLAAAVEGGMSLGLASVVLVAMTPAIILACK